MDMMTDISDHLSNLKVVLTDLDATGQEGFEGLIGTALSEIAGIPFRLARSGSQFGVDGRSAYAGAGICFECKRYAGKVPKSAIMSKIGELSIGETDIDLWVLCATSQIGSQIADNVSRFSERSSISTLILDARRSCSDKRFQRKFFCVRGDPSSLGQLNDGRGAVNHAPSPVRRAPAIGREPVQCSGSVRSIM